MQKGNTSKATNNQSLRRRHASHVVHERHITSGIKHLQEIRKSQVGRIGPVSSHHHHLNHHAHHSHPLKATNQPHEKTALPPVPVNATLTTNQPDSPPPPPKIRENPPLTLTKVDFEYLRHWDWEERKKRLESWKDVAATQNIFNLLLKRSILPSAEVERGGKRRSGKVDHKGLHLKGELESVTDLKFHPKPEVARRSIGYEFQKAREEQLSKEKSRQRLVKDDTRNQRHSGHRHRHRQSTHQEKRHQWKEDLVQTSLDTILDKGRAAELRKTFGKGWGHKRTSTSEKKTTPATTASSHRRRHSKGHLHSPSDTATTHSHRSHMDLRTDLEEEQVNTSFVSGSPSSSSSSSSSSDSKESFTDDFLKQVMSWNPNDIKDTKDPPKKDDGAKKGKEGEAKEEKPQETPPEHPSHPGETQEMVFGNVRFVEAGAIAPITKEKRGFEFYMTLGDPSLGIGMGKGEHFKVKFFKPTGPHIGHKKKRKMTIKASVSDVGEENDETEEPSAGGGLPEKGVVVKKFADLAEYLNEDEKLRRLSSLERTLREIPGISTGYEIEVQPLQTAPSTEAISRLPRRQVFTRPARRIWYAPLPLTIKKYYRTNWKRIKYDVRKRMRVKNYWPKLWINFEESHPKKMFDLVRAKMAVKRFDQLGFKQTFDWGRGVHPDYVDWILQDIVPHQGSYYYQDEMEPVRRPSMEEKDFKLKEWFVKPPRYIPDSPISPPFDMYDFCGYGNRQRPFFLAFTVPREILHFYAPASNIDKFFRQVPKPPYAFPGYTFKRWLKYPLEQKLPQYYPFPKRFSHWTRGKIGDRIQCSASEFKLDDPLIYKRDLTYSVYHDPHAKRYILRKEVLDRAWELGIINSKGEVRCSMKEFNKNRQFLRDYEWLEECLRRWNLQWTDRQQHNRLAKDTNYENLDWGSKNRAWHDRLYRCQQYAKVREEIERRKFKKIQDKYDDALEKAVQQREELQQEMLERARRKRKDIVRKRATVHSIQLHQTVIFRQRSEQRHMHAERQRRINYLNLVADKMVKQKDTWERKFALHQRRVAEVKQLQLKLDEEYKSRVWRHRKRMLNTWEDLPFANVRRRLKEERLMNIVRKYAMIWLEKVRSRRRLAPDEMHLSLWSNGHHLATTVDYLTKESGYVHAGDFFYNAIQINKQTGALERNKRPFSRKPTGNRKSQQSQRSQKDTAFSQVEIPVDDDDSDDSDDSDNKADGYDADDEDR